VSLWDPFRVRASQGTQFITDLRKAAPRGFRGLPRVTDAPCDAGCSACRDACPTSAIRLEGSPQAVALDLGRCVFCAACVEVCPVGKVALTNEPKMGSATREGLVVRERPGAIARDPHGDVDGREGALRVRANEGLGRMFGRSLRLRQVSAGGCNACELELNAIANVNFDIQRFGIEWVASPRHADAIVVSGPLTRTMHDAIRLAWDATPDPRFLVLTGACAISGGLYDGAAGVDRTFLDEVGPALYVPGCPPHPLTFVNAILDLLGVA
jgi:Ni,Fe-hydrogenase III small subunit/Pyruvate/2-oxoacid:ferredoxin oxidoreductase delta subunit